MYPDHYIAPDTLQQTILNVYGEAGKHWLDRLPCLLRTLVKLWNLKIEKECTNLSFSFTALVVLEDKNRAVLKCAPPNKEFTAKAGALQNYAGIGAAKLIAADVKVGWLLEERCIPGE